jgi:hypothetical protein
LPETELEKMNELGDNLQDNQREKEGKEAG